MTDMKKIMLALVLAGISGAAHANTYNFVPNDYSGNPTDIFDLEHHHAYSWGINFNLAANEVITGANVRIENIWDWRQENDLLSIDLLDNAKMGLYTVTDNSGDNVLDDYWGHHGGVALTTWTDPVGGKNTGFDFSYDFTGSQLALLTSYLGTPASTGRANFGLTFDPDCHYYNDGISFTITTETRNVPDGGATVVLAGGALLAVAALRRKLA